MIKIVNLFKVRDNSTPTQALIPPIQNRRQTQAQKSATKEVQGEVNTHIELPIGNAKGPKQKADPEVGFIGFVIGRKELGKEIGQAKMIGRMRGGKAVAAATGHQ